MNYSLNVMNNLIESKRTLLCKLIAEKNLTDDCVVICSQELDELLVMYEVFSLFSKKTLHKQGLKF